LKSRCRYRPRRRPAEKDQSYVDSSYLMNRTPLEQFSLNIPSKMSDRGKGYLWRAMSESLTHLDIWEAA